MKLIDLTHTFTDDMPVYPGDPLPRLERIAEIDSGGFTQYRLSTGMHAGTHIDAPLHMIPGGSFLSDQPVEMFFGPGHLLDARGCETIGEELLHGIDMQPRGIALILTGWYKNYRKPHYYEGYPEVALELARRLVRNGVGIVGLDTPSPDRAPFEVHRILLGAGVLIMENLCNLESLLGVPHFEIVALPAKLRCEGGPVRVVARIPSTG